MPKTFPNDYLKRSLNKKKRPKRLSKLKWYCQMCEKQCNDECGFRRHCATESHKYQLSLFAEDPDYFLSNFSQTFKNDFLELLKRRYGTNRVEANLVYQEYIKDSNHIHMNSTKWDTLQEFIEELSDEKMCLLEESEKGWAIAYIDRDPTKIKTKIAKPKRSELFDSSINVCLPKQVRNEQVVEPRQIEDFRRTINNKISFKLKPKIDLKLNNVNPSITSEITECDQTTKKTELQNILKIDNTLSDGWIITGIVVKVITDKIGQQYYLKKGNITNVEDKYVATVHMLDSGDIIKLDQNYLQTVIPAIGREVIVLEGHFRGCRAIVLKTEKDQSTLDIELLSEPFTSKIIKNISYDHVSKMVV